jgi:hypothetical protein
LSAQREEAPKTKHQITNEYQGPKKNDQNGDGWTIRVSVIGFFDFEFV